MVSGAPAHFIFNRDEIGHQDWADAHDQIWFVQRDAAENEVFYQIS
jgi:hypothetical protein